MKHYASVCVCVCVCVCLCVCVNRLDDDERLDAILATLRRKAPVPSPPPHTLAPSAGGASDVAPRSDTSSVKGELAHGLAEMRGRIKGLEERLAVKKKGLGAGGLPRK